MPRRPRPDGHLVRAPVELGVGHRRPVGRQQRGVVAEAPSRLGHDPVEHAPSLPDGPPSAVSGTIVAGATTKHRRPVLTFIRFDMRAPAWGPASAAELHAATLDMAEWADRVGFDSIVVSEHHGSEDGFLPSPIVAAAAIAGRTKTAGISISALLAPLHDPVRVAEDLAVLDLLSDGRVTTILGLGYRPEEYEMFGVPVGRARGLLRRVGAGPARRLERRAVHLPGPQGPAGHAPGHQPTPTRRSSSAVGPRPPPAGPPGSG